MANSPSIVIASLSDDQLKKSIDSLVTHVDEAMKKMVQSTNNAVGEMEAKLKSLGNLKIDSGGTNDGGTGRRTQQHEKLTKAVNDASEAVSKETQKLQDLQQSLSGASDREQNFISQKERAANTIAQENELLGKQQSELAALKAQEQQLADAHQRDMQARQQNAAAIEKQRGQVKFYEEELNSLQSKLASAQAKEDRYYSLLAKSREAISKSFANYTNDKYGFGYDEYEHGKSVFYKTERDVRSLIDALSKLKETNVRHGFLDEIKRPYAEMMQPSRDNAEVFKRFQEDLSIQIKALQGMKKGLRGDARKDIDDRIAAAKELLEVYKLLSNTQNTLNKTFSKENLLGASDVGGIKKDIKETAQAYEDAKQKLGQLTQATQQSSQASQQKAQIDAQIAAKEKEIAETKGRIAAATKEQSEADKNASQAAREKANIQSQVESQEKQVAEAKRQLTTATHQQAEVEKQSVQNIAQQTAARDKQIKKNQEVKMSFDQMQTALEKATRLPSEMRMEVAKSARESFYVFQSTLTQRARELTTEIKNAEAAFNSSLDAKLQTKQIEWQQRLEQTRQKLETFRTSVGDNPTVQQMREEQRLVNLMNQQEAILNKIRGQRWQMMEPIMALHKEETKVLFTMHDVASEQKQVEQTAERQSVFGERTATSLKKQADAIREMQSWKDKGYATIGDQVFYDPERSSLPKKDRLSLEEQILKKQIEQNEETRIAIQQQEEETRAVAGTAKMQQNVNDQQQKANEALLKRKLGTTGGSSDEEYLRTQIASLLDISEKEVRIVKTKSASYNELNTYLKQLQSAYQRLGSDLIAKGEGKDIADEIQRVQRAVQKFQSQMNRPTSLKAALGLDEKTLDDIAYKMRQLQSYRQGIDISDPKSAKTKQELDEVGAALDRLKKKETEILGTNKTLIESNAALGRSWNYMKNRLAFYLTVGASTTFLKNLVNVRSQYELLERSIGILIDSAQNGSRIFSELNAMALKSPFTTMELGAAAKQLVAYDVAAKDVVDTTKRLADMAAAVGIPIERLTYALGQIKAYGYLNARDARMFANAGIPLVKELADRYTELEGRLVSTADVYDRIKKKAISYEDVMETVNKMTDEGGKFFNFQEKSADTLKVKIANLTLAWNNMLNEMGKDSQGVIGGMLNITKSIFEKWRDINNLLTSIVVTLGLAKAAQMAYLILTSKTLTATRSLAILTKVIGKKGALDLASLGSSFIQYVGNPAKLAGAAITALGIALVKAFMDYKDLIEANKNFNKSIVDSAEENIKSIDKFFSDYKEQLSTIDNANTSDQQKMWERLQEEIEKTNKNAEQYIRILEEIQNIGQRIEIGKSILEQTQEIEKEVKRLAELQTFSLGGGFADDPLAKNLQKVDEYTATLINNFETIDKARERLGNGMGAYATLMSDYVYYIDEADKELDTFVSKLDKADIFAIMGDNPDTQLANIRMFANMIRDSFLTTEEGQKITSAGQARLNAKLDEWIAKQGLANGAIQDITDGTKTWSAKSLAEIESNRTAWEAFFEQLNRKERERLDYLIDTNQTGSEEFQELWDRAAKNMSEKATASYELISQQIANLRNTPDIVINVVYKESTQRETDPQRSSFVEKYLKPKNWFARGLSATDYMKEQAENTQKYGRYIKKQQEDNVEWEKRLGQEYQNNAAKIQSLNKQLENRNNLDEVDRKAKEDQLQTLRDSQAILTEISKDQGFNYEQQKKKGGGGRGGKKDEILESLKQEISLVDKLRSEYDKLMKSGATQADAIENVRSSFGKTITLLNAKLGSKGLPTLDLEKVITGKDPHVALEHFKKTLDTLVAKGLLNLERSKELEGVIQKLTLSAKTYDLEKITKGLNSELDKLKDEYELAVDLDANPELGDMFANMFGIDTSTLPSGIWEYTQAIQDAVDHAIQEEAGKYEKSLFEPFNILTDDLKTWADKNGIEVGSALYSGIEKAQNAAKDANKKYYSDIVKQTKDLEYKLADTNGKIAIEEEKLARLQEKLAKEVNDEKRRLLELQIQDQQNAILKLKEEVLQMLPTYVNLYSSIAEHSSMVTRRIAEQWKEALRNALKNPDGSYTVTDPKTGERATISEKQYGKEIDKVNQKLRSTQSTFKKIKEAFTEGEDGIIDWVKGLELLAAEAKKVAGSLKSVAEIVGSLGGDTATVNQINDLSSSLENLSDVAEGFVRIEDGDILGGIQTALSGISGIVSTLADRLSGNADINENIEKSERCVKRLELAYIDLEHAVSKTYGVEAIGVKKAIAYNKELQLVQLKRQLALEESRSEKNKDKDRIIELRKQIKELEYEIKDTIDEITNDMLGISGIGDAAESLVSSMIDAFKNGEDYMLKYTESFDKMIENMIVKTIAAKVIGQRIEEIWNQVQENAQKRASKEEQDYKKAYEYYENTLQWLDGASDKHFYYFDPYAEEVNADKNREISEEEWKDLWNKRLEWLRKLYEKAVTPTPEDVKNVKDLSNSFYDDVKSEFDAWMDAFGIKYGEGADKNLSALQQGIQSITEDTAGALEAITNGISQQCYLQSDLLTQIRDAVISMDMDVSLGVMSQILLHLQSSYQIQQSMLLTMENWTNPSGNAVRVELIS